MEERHHQGEQHQVLCWWGWGGSDIKIEHVMNARLYHSISTEPARKKNLYDIISPNHHHGRMTVGNHHSCDPLNPRRAFLDHCRVFWRSSTGIHRARVSWCRSWNHSLLHRDHRSPDRHRVSQGLGLDIDRQGHRCHHQYCTPPPCPGLRRDRCHPWTGHRHSHPVIPVPARCQGLFREGVASIFFRALVVGYFMD